MVAAAFLTLSRAGEVALLSTGDFPPAAAAATEDPAASVWPGMIRVGAVRDGDLSDLEDEEAEAAEVEVGVPGAGGPPPAAAPPAAPGTVSLFVTESEIVSVIVCINVLLLSFVRSL